MTTETGTTDDFVLTPSEGGSRAWADVKAGVYRAWVDEIKDVGISEMYPADGPRFEITFALLDERDEEGLAVTLRTWCSQKMTTGKMESNLWKWATALGAAPKVNVPFRVADLLKRECQIVVEIKNAGTDKARPKITNVLPAAPGSEARPSAPATAAPVATAPADTCKVEGCGGVVDKYTLRGTPLCVAHTSEDL